MSTPELASVEGAITPTAEAMIPMADDGLYRGDGVFEVIRLYAGRPLAFAEHLDRLERSAAAIHLDAQRETLELEIDALLEAHGDADAQVRLIVTRGGRRIAAIEPLADWGETVGLKSVTYAPTVILSGVKSLSYGANMQATRIAQAAGADEALLVRPDGVVLEAPTSTIFWCTGDGVLATPPLDDHILASITRAYVIDATGAEERVCTKEELEQASEAFLASTTREVQPVSQIEEIELAAPGKRTREAAKGLRARIEEALAAAG
jgi:branched-chain amino acid aminotransferase